MELETLGRKQVIVQTEKTPLVEREQPLVPDIVDGEGCSDGGESRISFGLGFEKCDRQGSLPVMGVKDIGGIDSAEHFQGSPAEERESFRVVGVISVRGTVKVLSVEVTIRLGCDKHLVLISNGTH